MRRIISLIGLAICMVLTLQAQDFDVTKHRADMKTFIFDNNRNTVKGFILLELEQKTTCCGQDRIYLEVKVDPEGNVLHAKPLTGKNDCFKNSAVDIVKNVKWNAEELRGPKSVYLEIKPNIESCDGRDNVYRALPVYNTGDAGSQPTQPVATAPTKEEPKPTPPVKETPTPTPAPAEKETPKETTPVVQSEPVETQPVQTAPTRPITTTTTDVVMNNDPEPKEMTPEEKEAQENRAAQQEEIELLRKKLADMRTKESDRQKKEAARQAKIEERRAAQEAAEAAESDFANSADLFGDDPYGTGEGDGDGFSAEGGDEGGDEEYRMQQQIEELRAQIQEIADRNRQREDEIRAALDAQQEANSDILRIEEEIAARQEDVERYREEKELAQMEQDRVAIEDERSKDQDDYQRLVDEINRLQAEAEAKVAELEAKKNELANIDKLKVAREKEITLQRQMRDKERQLYLEQVRLSLVSQGTPVVALSDNATGSDSELMQMLPDLTAEVDSEKMKILINTIQQMQIEMQRLREQIRLLEGGTSTSTSGTATQNPYVSPSNKDGDKGTKSNGQRNGNSDRSWETLDYADPNADPSIYQISPKYKQQQQGSTTRGNDGPAPEYKPGRGYDPDPSHKGTHVNTTGPKFERREYVGGKAAMKDFIKTELKAGGICGLAQAVFAVTLDPQGNVIGHQVLASNADMVNLNLNNTLPKLKFDKAEVRYDQTIYIEFKAEILCEGTEGEINLQEVKDIINE